MSFGGNIPFPGLNRIIFDHAALEEPVTQDHSGLLVAAGSGAAQIAQSKRMILSQDHFAFFSISFEVDMSQKQHGVGSPLNSGTFKKIHSLDHIPGTAQTFEQEITAPELTDGIPFGGSAQKSGTGLGERCGNTESLFVADPQKRCGVSIFTVEILELPDCRCRIGCNTCRGMLFHFESCGNLSGKGGNRLGGRCNNDRSGNHQNC